MAMVFHIQPLSSGPFDPANTRERTEMLGEAIKKAEFFRLQEGGHFQVFGVQHIYSTKTLSELIAEAERAQTILREAIHKDGEK